MATAAAMAMTENILNILTNMYVSMYECMDVYMFKNIQVLCIYCV